MRALYLSAKVIMWTMEYFSTGRPVNSTLSVMTTPDCVEADYDFYSVTQVILGL